METTIVYWGLIWIMEKKIETRQLPHLTGQRGSATRTGLPIRPQAHEPDAYVRVHARGIHSDFHTEGQRMIVKPAMVNSYTGTSQEKPAEPLGLG